MSDTVVTPEETNLETPETSSVEEVAQAPEAPKAHSRDDRKGDRKPRRDGNRNGIREEEKEFREEMLSIDRVTRVTAGGRQLRFRASIVIGDGKGRVGLGIGKSGEVQ